LKKYSNTVQKAAITLILLSGNKVGLLKNTLTRVIKRTAHHFNPCFMGWTVEENTLTHNDHKEQHITLSFMGWVGWTVENTLTQCNHKKSNHDHFYPFFIGGIG
jgi:hypothetical protein